MDPTLEGHAFIPRLPEDRTILTAGEAARLGLARAGLTPLVGAEGSGPALVSQALSAQGARQVVYVAASSELAQQAAGDLAALGKGLPLAHLPKQRLNAPLVLSASESTPYAEVHADRRATMLRTAALCELLESPLRSPVVLTAATLVRRVPPPQALRDATLVLTVEQELDVVAFSQRLTAAGYLRAPVVEDPGSYALRGGIIDLWPGQLPAPIRVEMYGDLVASIKVFDAEDQRTQNAVERVVAPPARDAIVTRETEARAREQLRSLCDAVNFPSTKTRSLIDDLATGRAFFGSDGYLPAFYPLASVFDYLAPDAVFVIDDPIAVVRAIHEELERGLAGEAARRGTPHFPARALYLSQEELEQQLRTRSLLALHRTAIAAPASESVLENLESAPADAPTLAFSDLSDLARAVKGARSEHGKQGALEPLLERVRAYLEAGLEVVICARTETQAERLCALLSHRGANVRVWRTDDALTRDAPVRIVTAPLSRGVLAPTAGFVLITEEEIFGSRAHRPPEKKRSARALLQDLQALSVGDFVVHVDHGVGRYLGLERRAIGAVHVDLLVVEYAGGDKLFLPVYRLNQIEKYAGGDTTPKVDRLGGQTFSKTKARVERRVRQMADELLKLYAERAALKKDPLTPPDDEYRAFEASFPFEETRDQASAIAEVLKDIQSERVMDRLVCGDVGFGKTEVALRAAFFNALGGRQVALLCPTTVLAQQHFNTFSARFSGYPLTVRAMSRFESKAEQQDTLKGLKEGSVDVVIGTHRLLSKDVHFKRLGLLVVDEEQRFGVTHKERIKQMRMSVDVLTLSATPIPRTLQLAVGGMRDMSIITTPPVDRRAIRTVVSQYDPGMVKEAISRELERGGQVFYVYNRVDGIYERAERIRELLPSARVAVGHGQMSESALEQTMFDFVQGEYDVLVATAIIESGLDIPRANTIIVDRADLFGLSQLYQLRGRVGRANERAYAYLLVPPASQLSDEARSRIEALERYTELGSGFHIATLDMELRGGGDLLGAEQSGFVESVGFDLFCKMLEDATHELRGETVVHEVDPDLNFDVEALLPEDYIDEVGVRLSLYKRLSSAADEAEVNDLAREMEDRFGPPPLPARRLVELMRVKTELRRLRAVGCEASAKSATLHLLPDTPLDPAKISALVAGKKSLYRLSPDGRLTRRAGEQEALSDGLVLADRMLSELARCYKD
ncbi:MAG TPA: transcription-repair coupling factor [Polyangiaceae bacterium]|nr:transcription-repair coupling factor [Polyangiaceae bacterium]